MRLFVPLFAIFGLASCTSKPVHITAGQCWSVTAGDKIQGTAILFVASPFTFHVGPRVGGGPNCPRYSVKFASPAVGKAYGEITNRQLPDDPQGGPTEGVIMLSGDVIDGADRGSSTIQITHIRLTKPAKS